MNDDKKRLQVLQMQNTGRLQPVRTVVAPNISVKGLYGQPAPRPQPAPQILQRPQQSFFNKVRDTFDANTESDYFRRAKEQQKAGQPVQRQSYTQQQQESRRDNVQSIELNPFKRVLAEVTEAPRRIGFGLARNTGQQSKTDDSILSLQRTRDDVILNAQRKIKNPSTSPIERARWIKYLEKEYPQAQIDDREARMELRRNIKDADPVAGLAAVSETGLDLLTAGAGGVVLKGARRAAKQGIKPLIKFTGQNLAKPVLPAAGGGAIGSVTSQGSDVTPSQIALGAGAGAAFGLLFGAGSGATGGVSKTISDVFKSKNSKKIISELAQETNIDSVISKLDEAGVPENKIVEIAQDITTATTSEQVENTLRKAANVPEAISDDVVKAITSVKQPKQLRDAVKTLFPEFDDSVVIQLSRQLAETTDNNSIRQILEEAQVRSKTLKETTEQATPVGEQVKPNSQGAQNQAELEQIATEQPVQATSVTDEAIDARPTTTAVQGATTADNVPGATVRTTDDSLKEIAQLAGVDIGESNIGLGAQNSLMSTLTGGRVKNLRKANIFRTVADATGKRINEATEANITGSGAPVANKARALFAGTGLTDETKQISRIRQGKFANIKDLVERIFAKDNEIQAKYGDQAQDLLDRVMRDPEYTQRVYGEAPRDISTLPEDLQNLALEKVAQNKIVNDINLQTGVIDEGQWAQGAQGQHIGRIFAIPKEEVKFLRESLNSMFESNASIKRKDISKFTDEVIELLEKDPIRAIDLRMEMALRNQAITEAMDAYAARGFIQKTKPNNNFIQMNGKRYGKYDGQYVERGMLEELTGNRIFQSGMAESFDRLVNSYKSSILGVSDRLQKAFKTTMAPGTIIGNISSNPLIFNPGAGTNPLTQVYDMLIAARKMGKGLSDADVYTARQLGVIGGDTGKLLTGSSSEQMAMQAQKLNIPKRVLSKFGQFYGNIDDTAKMGLWTRLQKQGLDPQTAALEVAKFTQDYNNVGRVITLIADTPVLGKPFARFSPELMRIIKNNTTRAPHRIIAGVAGLAYLNNKLSKDSGETPEERKARESAVGQTLLPGTAWLNKAMGGPNTDVSLNIPVGDSAVNVSRAMGLNFPMEPGVDPSRAILEQLIPIEIPTRKNSLGEDVFDPTKVVTSMTLRPFVEQAFDQNFMGTKVSDPTNRAYDSQGQVMKFTDLPAGDQVRNRLKALGTALSPLGNEIDSISSALRNKPTATGKERTIPQALLRSVGIKVDNNDAETRKRRLDTAEFFEVEKKQEQKFLQENKNLEQLYFSIYPKTKDRNTGKKISDQITPEKWAKVQSDTSGKMFDFMRQQALAKEKKGQPIDPIFKISGKDDLKQVLELRSKPTAEDIEMDNILEATQSWYRDFKKAESKYYQDSAKFYESLDLPDTENQRAKDYRNVKYPELPPLVQQYYSLRTSDPDSAKNMFATTSLSDEFDKYELEKLKYYNAKRKIEGYPPISATTFDNVTFGYEEDESKVFNELKYQKGLGGFRFGSGKGRSKKDETPRQYLGTLLAGVKPLQIGSQPNIDFTPTRTKFRVKTPSGKGRNFRRIKLN